MIDSDDGLISLDGINWLGLWNPPNPLLLVQIPFI